MHAGGFSIPSYLLTALQTSIRTASARSGSLDLVSSQFKK
jgi:hypothetical protein